MAIPRQRLERIHLPEKCLEPQHFPQRCAGVLGGVVQGEPNVFRNRVGRVRRVGLLHRRRGRQGDVPDAL